MAKYEKVVDQDSATLGYPGEEDVPLPLSHVGLVRYRDVDDDNYYRTKASLRVKLLGIIGENKATPAPSSG